MFDLIKENLSASRVAALVGPTASGKSDIALKIAQETGAEILSCDSLLVYRDLNIGTAKPSEAEQRAVVHHGINWIDLDSTFTAGDFVRRARPLVDAAIAANKPLLIVGGTGFYLKALIRGVWDAPPAQPEFRAALEASVSGLSIEEQNARLHALLVERDPVHARKIEPNDRYRVVRALEIMEVAQKPVSEIATTIRPNAYDFPIFGITRSKPDLERRIAQRVDRMFATGLVQETKLLLARYAGQSQNSQPAQRPRALYCVGYKEVLDFLDGRLTLPECRERIVISTRQLAKKQMTYFRSCGLEVAWHTLPAEEDAVVTAVRRAL